jgi:hypothetical protein
MFGSKDRGILSKSYTSLVLRDASLKRNTCTQVLENMDLNVLYNHNYLFQVTHKTSLRTRSKHCCVTSSFTFLEYLEKIMLFYQSNR